MIDQVDVSDLLEYESLVEFGLGEESGSGDFAESWPTLARVAGIWAMPATPMHGQHVDSDFDSLEVSDEAIGTAIYSSLTHSSPFIRNSSTIFSSHASHRCSIGILEHVGSSPTTWFDSLEELHRSISTLVSETSIDLSTDSGDRHESTEEAFQSFEDFNFGYTGILSALERLDFARIWVDSVVCEIESSGRSEIANRIRQLNEEISQETDQDPIDMKSLRHLAAFFVDQSKIPDPEVFVTRDGLLQIEWETTNEETVAMEFLSDGWIQFAGISPRVLNGDGRGTISGVLPRSETLIALSSFIKNV